MPQQPSKPTIVTLNEQVIADRLAERLAETLTNSLSILLDGGVRTPANTTARSAAVSPATRPDRSSPNVAADQPTVFVVLDEWMRISGDGRSTSYEKIRDGRLRAVRDGGRLKIDLQHGLEHLRSLPRAVLRPSVKKVPDPQNPTETEAPVAA